MTQNRSVTVAFEELETAPAAPTNLQATAASTSQINLTWTRNSTNETGFEVERCTGASCSNFQRVHTTGPGATSWQNTGLSAGTTYRYRVRAVNNGGASGYSNSQQATTEQATTEVEAPTNLRADGVSDSQIDLSWFHSGSGVTSFEIQWRGGGTWNDLATVGGSVRSFNDTGLPANSTYEYRVRACASGGGCSSYSIPDSGTTFPPALPAPQNLQATAVSTSQINLNWSHSGSGVAQFRIEWRFGTWGWEQIATVPGSARSFSDTGLPANTTNRYRVRACNSSGDCSSYSNEASATTDQAPPVATGDIRIFFSGLPSGESPAITVFRSNGSVLGNCGSTSNPCTFNNVAVGNYRIRVYNKTTMFGTYVPSWTERWVTVEEGRIVQESVAYSPGQ